MKLQASVKEVFVCWINLLVLLIMTFSLTIDPGRILTTNNSFSVGIVITYDVWNRISQNRIFSLTLLL